MFIKQSLNPNSATIYNSNILVVDDTSLNRELVSSYLESEGYTHIEMAEHGQDALDKMENFMPDLIISDLLMPVMGGIEYIKKIKKSDQYRHIPIIVQTALTTNEEKQEAWSSGANDVLSKPIHRLELLSRVKVQLVTMHMIKQLENYYTMAQKDIKQAFTLQKSLLPSVDTIANIEKRYNLQVDYIFEPSRFLSGDMWGLVEIDDTQLGVWICDYSGKGIQAALNTFRIHTLVQEYANSAATPSEMIDLINRRFHEMISVGQFATFLMGIVDIKAKKFRYVGASAPDPIIYFPSKKEFALCDGAGLPLGVTANALYPERQIDAPKGSSIILYSDLLWEPKSLPGVCLLPEYLPAFMDELQGKNLVSTLRTHLDMLGDIKLNDDLTLIEIKL
ncbi:MAG: fused response regulator/phosphatase [Alphaproteobacteria bacterium]|nr:fused response regulator/phosphatase [Alphaproteobacteria bacterium]